ncbi:DNA primase [Alicyclobacillus acidoterrestris]|uniref:DNA primase n=1 Tax=Alicyclobacillus suci TaxID=2816080 RepID=UPI0011931AF5|nr:DNA primase [Alicyclobacillus suci]GEO26840.1 DNA primase [Alicyclobacillus acidoterrestris]
MSKVPEWFLQELRQKVDIVDVVSDYVQLRRSGRSYSGLCPFHNERTPSFSVSQDRGMYHCFGCGAGGTVINFVMDIEGVSFQEAVIVLAERAGLTVPEGLGAGATQPNTKQQRHREAHDLAAQLYGYILMNMSAGVQALSYLEKRGISRKTIVDFRLGFAPNSQDVLVSALRRRGFQDEELVSCGLAVEMGNRIVDRFRGRIMIPICDKKGEVVAFGGRTMLPDGKPKYLNSPENDVFHKSRLLYNFHVARKFIRQQRTAILLEGYMDVISLTQAGISSGVASLGTSLTEEQAKLLKADADRVVIAYDGDAAGRKAAIRAIDILQGAGIEPVVLSIPDGLDPDEYVRTYGGEAFTRLLSRQTMSVVQFLLDDLRQTANLVSSVGRTDFVRSALQLLAQRATPVEQEYELRNLSQEFNLSVETLKEELRVFTKQNKRHREQSVERTAQAIAAQPLERAVSRASTELLKAVLFDEQAAAYVMEKGLTELAEPLQTALLAQLYAWRLANPTSDPSTFVDELEDEPLVQLASSLFFGDDIPEFSQDLLDDYVRTVERHHLEEDYRVLLRRWIEVEASGDTERAREIKLQVEQLQDQIATLKLPREQNAGGVKEAGM